MSSSSTIEMNGNCKTTTNNGGSESFKKILDIHNNLNRSNFNNNNKCIVASSLDSEKDASGGISATTITTNSEHKFSDKVFGWGKFQPKFLQRFCTAKWALFWLCWGGAMQGLIVNGFINISITTIERRFGLRSRQTGLVASGYDIASFICLVPVSYFGGRIGASKPRWIAWGIILMGFGSIVFALPHFIASSYKATFAEDNTCQNDRNSTVDYCNEEFTSNSLEKENLSWSVWFFFAAQLLHGAGASPLFTLGVTYIDENVSKKMSSVYLGIYYTMAVIGPAIGYVLGGQLLQIYTDFLTVDSATLGLTSLSKVWIGAWWIGFFFAALACVLLSIPIFGYPKSLPGSEEIKLERVSEAYNGKSSEKDNQSFTKLRELPKALLSLLRNPTFFFLNLAGASEGLVIAGFSAFLPKEIENQFSISPIWSALIMGIIVVPAGGGGTFLGGYLIKKFDLACAGIIRMCLIATTISAFFTMSFLLSCKNLSFAGVTSAYNGIETSNGNMDYAFQLEDTCNSGCHCSRMNYDPICGSDGVMYFSPCHAGCQQERAFGESKIYLDCDCIKAPENATYEAINTMCESGCSHLWYFVFFCFILMLFTFLATMPALAATLRCVQDEQRSFALGIQWIKVRLLGTIPAPLIFGSLIDETCILWKETCEEHGACLVYDNNSMSRSMWILALTGKISSVLFFFGAWWFYIPPKTVSDNNGGGVCNAINSDNNSHDDVCYEEEESQSQHYEQQVHSSIEADFMNENSQHAQKHANSSGRF
ncbi:solute carrier organic anion transporter family member 4A1 [Episyrphus balteatus]|uniref:solute carrier organic anion transporter family member 4A1 n=1 Tax=Episyrphus balteatus TaxID=286459 RepID=UPI0024854732|nr:solute carrier organic anion transporter family member 4A1 [Episyrphus balteatus]